MGNNYLPFSYYLLLFIFLSPIPAVFINFYAGSEKVFPIVKKLLPFFLCINLIACFGYSIKGDYPDYIIVALESFCLNLLLFSTNIFKKIWVKILRIAGFVAMVFSLIIGLIGTVIFILIAHDIDAVEQYHVAKSGKDYEIRRMPSNGLDAVYSTYVFDVYRESGPFEHSLCSFRLDDDYYANHWDFENGLQFHVLDTQNCKFLVVTDTAGHRFSQQLK